MGNLTRLLKESWSLVEEQQEKVAGYFYARLFLSDPRLRDLFPVQIDVQRARVLRTIVQAVQTMEDAEHFDEHLRALGRDHRKFDVLPAHYDLVGEALVEALRAFAGEEWCWEYEQAWRDGYAEISRRMQAGAAADSNPPYWHAEVAAHARHGSDVAVFTCRTSTPLPYRPGQYVTIESAHHPRLWRAYAVANAPRRDNLLEFHVRASGAGWVSGALVRRLRPGDPLKIGAPMGDMVLDRRSARDLVCVAGETGLAPIKALIDELTTYNRTRWVHVFMGARDRDHLYQLDVLSQWAARFPWLSVVPSCSDDETYPGERGPVHEVMHRYGPWAEHDFFVAGPAATVQPTMATLRTMKVPSTRVRHITFGD